MMSSTPYPSVMAYGAMHGQIHYENVKFYDFKQTLESGSTTRMFTFMEHTPDFLPPTTFKNFQFIDSDQNALADLFDPPSKWAIIKDCGNFPCTAPHNTFIKFVNARWTGNTDYASNGGLTPDFQMLPNNRGVTKHLPSCRFVQTYNAYICNEVPYIATLSFESLDADKEDRSMQPVYIQKKGTAISNKINAMMDNCWDGFYTCQLRLQRFNGIMYADKGSIHDVLFTGTPAKHMRFTMISDNNKAGTTVRIHYPSAQSYNILKNGEVVNYNAWDEVQKAYGEVRQNFCGENRFIGVKNILEFYVTPGCILEIKPKDAIMASVRMEWTFGEFFAEGGSTTFADRMAAALGIHASEIKMVAVYEGSLIIDYMILKMLTGGPTLAETQQKHIDMMARGQMNLGAPILNSQVAAQPIVTDGRVVYPGYEPIIITRTSTN